MLGYLCVCHNLQFLGSALRRPLMHVLYSAAALLLIVPSLTLADAAVYSWRNADGTMTFTDNPALAPRGAAVHVRSYATSNDDLARAVTQREFAHRLAIELGLGNRFTGEQAAEALAEVGIAPRLGKWDLDAAMSSALVERLRTLTVAAALSGKITLDPEQAIFAFDSTAALVGIKIRDTTAAAPASPPETPIAPAPVYLAPTSELVSERVIYVGGGIADPLFAGGLPTIVIDQRIINIDNRVVVRKRAKPEHRAPRTVHRARLPQPKHGEPYTARSQRTRAGRNFRQHGSGEIPQAAAGRTVLVPRQVSTERTVMPSRRVDARLVVRPSRQISGHAIAGSSAHMPVISGGYSVR